MSDTIPTFHQWWAEQTRGANHRYHEARCKQAFDLGVQNGQAKPDTRLTEALRLLKTCQWHGDGTCFFCEANYPRHTEACPVGRVLRGDLKS